MFHLSADQGNSYAQFSLWIIYSSGSGINKDLDTAIKWLVKAVDQSDPEALYQLGVQYYNREGVTKDKTTSSLYIEKVYNLGYPKAETFWNKNELWKYKKK